MARSGAAAINQCARHTRCLCPDASPGRGVAADLDPDRPGESPGMSRAPGACRWPLHGAQGVAL